ncbi:MAG: hypothetical protein IT374_02600 [Polyangiaceae bacterium]|nr:hypothetical protein [Polyangiaceae bacterium]
MDTMFKRSFFEDTFQTALAIASDRSRKTLDRYRGAAIAELLLRLASHPSEAELADVVRAIGACVDLPGAVTSLVGALIAAGDPELFARGLRAAGDRALAEGQDETLFALLAQCLGKKLPTSAMSVAWGEPGFRGVARERRVPPLLVGTLLERWVATLGAQDWLGEVLEGWPELLELSARRALALHAAAPTATGWLTLARDPRPDSFDFGGVPLTGALLSTLALALGSAEDSATRTVLTTWFVQLTKQTEER